MYNVLVNLGAVELDSRVIRTEFTYRLQVGVNRFATLDEPLSVVKALQYLYTNRCPETTSIVDAETILKYFQNGVSSMDSSFVSELKMLPLFETVERTLTDLPPSRDASTLPPDLPPAGSAVWMAEANCTFLTQKYEFSALYKKLDLNSKTSDEVYVDYILPRFPKISQDDRIVHLVSLIQRLRSLKPSLLEALKDTPCFDKQGVSRRISEFYDPNVGLFALMLTEEEFPPTLALPKYTHYKDEWLPSLRNLGLKAVCSTSEFLNFGEIMEKETRTWQPAGHEPADFEEWTTKSREMVTYLTELEDHWSDNDFMKRMSRIRFLPSQRVDGELKRLATPFYEHDTAARYATSYSEGVCYTVDNEMLCWTSQALIRQSDIIMGQSFRSAAGIQMHPNLESVLTHFNLLVEEVKRVILPNRNIQAETTVPHLTNALAVIFRHLLTYIVNASPKELPPFADLHNSAVLAHGLSSNGVRIVSFLTKSPCVFIPDKQMFVKPHQVVFSLEEELYPYVFQLPRDFAPYHLLLKRSGVDEKPRPFHCARVLEALKEKYGDRPVSSPGDGKVLITVVRLLFETLKQHTKPLDPSLVQAVVRNKIEFTEQDIEEALQPLYLPSRNEVLKLSSELVFLERLHLERHVGSLRYSFLMDLMKCGLSPLEEMTVNLLPSSLRPCKVSDLTEEVLDPECQLAGVADDHVAAVYQERYSSHLFVQGIRSIYIYMARSGDILTVLEAGLSILQDHFRVVCVPEIRTCLRPREGGELMKLDDVRKCCFLERSESEATLYLQKASAVAGLESESHIKLYGLIVVELQALLHFQLPDLPMIMIVSCRSPELIPTTLNELNIPFVQGNQSPQVMGKLDCRPGMDLLPDHLALLRQPPLGYRLNVDDWVAYEREENHFVYAVILYREISEDETASELRTRYGIDVGEETLEVVSALCLYTFVVDGEKEPDEPERSLVVTGAATSPSMQTAPEEEKEAVRKQLHEIWQLPAEERRRAIRRLYLQWHPDKTDDPHGADVFMFVKYEIKRLERGGNDATGSYSSYYEPRPTAFVSAVVNHSRNLKHRRATC